MKDGFKSITIEPFNGYLDFQGPINPQNSTNNLVLKGDIHLHLSKAIKVKRAAIKFVGSSRVCHKNTLDVVDISTPILPKLKTQLFTSTTNLGPGLVILPWEIEIPNCYPCSVMMKRASISYKVELSISLGLHRSVTAEYPIVIKRHLLPCVEVAPLVPTKLYTKTISTKFHYEIDAPRIVCTAQQTLPIAIKLLTIGTHKPVLSIRTQLIQVELYRCNTLPKTDADMSKFKTQLLGQKATSSTTSKKGESSKYAKYTKRTSPAIIHTLDETRPISSNQPLLLRHPLGEYLALGLESPLAAIYHQLEITFQFGAKFEEVRAKVPILIASAGPSPLSAHPLAANGKHQQQKFLPLALYPFEKISVMEPLFVMDESRLDYHPTASQRMPTPTPSSTSSSDRVTVNDDEVTGYLEIITNHRKQIRENGTASRNHNNITEEKQSLRRTRSADLMIDTPPIDDPSEHRKTTGNKHYLQIPQQPRHQRHFQHTTIHSHTKSMHINHMNSIPRHLHEKLSSATSRNNNTEMSPGMWPRPDTKVPHQWRRRSSSQPYSSIDSSTSTPPRPAKDPKRFLPYASTGKTPLQYPGGLRTMAAAAAAARALYPLPADSISLEDNSTCSTSSSNHHDFDETSTTGSSSSTTTSSTASSSSYVNSSCRSSISASSSLPYQPQSRPNSPAFSPAPGLPSSTVLRPQNANPVALLEESFVPPSPATSTFSPSYWTDSLTSQQLQHRESLQYTQGFTRSSSNRYNLTKSSDTMSVISTAQSSILDPDEDMIQMMEAMEIQYRQHLEQKRLLEQHYTYAELPPIPSNIPSTSSATTSAATSAPALDRLTTMHFGDESSEYSDEESSGVNDADDDDDSVDGDGTTETTNSTHNNNATSIKSLPYQELPPDDDDPVCLCPKHGVIVARR